MLIMGAASWSRQIDWEIDRQTDMLIDSQGYMSSYRGCRTAYLGSVPFRKISLPIWVMIFCGTERNSHYFDFWSISIYVCLQCGHTGQFKSAPAAISPLPVRLWLLLTRCNVYMVDELNRSSHTTRYCFSRMVLVYNKHVAQVIFGHIVTRGITNEVRLCQYQHNGLHMIASQK